jgi:hypothetical protein
LPWTSGRLLESLSNSDSPTEPEEISRKVFALGIFPGAGDDIFGQLTTEAEQEKCNNDVASSTYAPRAAY